jgi:hypothetical protein
MAEPAFNPRPSNHNECEVKTNLGAVADAIYLKRTQAELVRALGLHQSALWPDKRGLSGHFCTYRVLARLAREDVLAEAVTFNYDCGFEAGLHDEGFMFSNTTLPGHEWFDHATVIADAATNSQLDRRGAFVLIKAHGCAARYREVTRMGFPDSPEDAIVIRWSQLLDWRRDSWVRDIFCERARRHVLLLIGFSGQDPVVHITLTRVLEEVYKSAHGDPPRVVVVGRSPDTLTLRMLAKAGAAGSAPGVVTSVSTRDTTTTAVALILLVELLAQRLEPMLKRYAADLPGHLNTRLALLAVAAPTMMRWSFLLRRPVPWRDYTQRINLEQAAEHGYVPLMGNPHATARALHTRTEVRAALGLGPYETILEAVANHGFIVKPGLGRAFLPVGLDHAALLAAVTHGALEQTRLMLPRPKALDCVLVANGATIGISVDTGAEVTVP